jgi:excisionase family DNA binding protein
MTIDEMKNLQRPARRADVASVLGCDVRTVDHAIEDGTIKSFRIGRRVFVPVKPLLTLLEGGEFAGS